MEQDANRAGVRSVRQQLESWQLAGLTHLPRVSRPAVSMETAGESPVPQAVVTTPLLQKSASAPAAISLDTPELERGVLPSPPVSSRTFFQESTPAPVTPAPTPTESTVPLSREERINELQIINERVATCTRCDELARTRTKTVFGVGDPQAKILFIGEAPGADEDRQGEPFVGRAGQLLTKIIEACKLKREQVYICNVLKCRPPENRTPLPDECTNCREYLDAQLRIISPEYIVCWGAVAAQNLLGSTLSIGKLRKQFFRHGGAKVLCTYHPSYLLRNPAAKKDVWDDMKLLFADMGVDLSQT